MSSLTESETEEVSKKLLECCEKAYLNGLNSADIYKVLHSKEVLEPLENNITKSSTKQYTDTTQPHIPSSNPKNNNSFTSIKKTICGIITLTFLTLMGHLILCKLISTNPLKYFPTIQEKRCLLPSHPLIMEMVRPIANCSICHPVQKILPESTSTWTDPHNHQFVIELLEIPCKTAFREIAYLSKPIIIRKAGIRGGMPEFFNFARLREIFESEMGGVDTVSEECQFLPFRSPFKTLRDAFDIISDTSKWNEPWYIGWSNCHPGVAAKLRKLFPRPTFLPEDSESSAIDWIFIGSPGLGAAMHIDYVRRPSWQAQLSGVKTWFLRPPPECEDVCPESVTFRINPGDILFLETNTWYHQTFIEGDNLSISIGSEYD